MSRHRHQFLDKGINPELLHDSRIVYLEANTYEEHLGLDYALYQTVSGIHTYYFYGRGADSQKLLSTVNVVIHCAWATDFYMTLGEFENNISGMRNLIQLGRDASVLHPFKFLYISSLLVSESWDPTVRLYPENETVDLRTAEGTGFGESQYVSHAVCRVSNSSNGSVLNVFI
jgi:hypothetical protein